MLPTGYAGMILLSLVPPLWRRVMDARVLEHYDGDMSLANISPRKRDRVLARFSTSTADAAGVVDESPGAAVAADRVRVARCPGCGYTYDEAIGDAREGFPAGTAWASVPDSWCCPDCGVRDKIDFIPVEVVDA